MAGMTVTDVAAGPRRMRRLRAVLTSPVTWVVAALPLALSPLVERDEGASDLWWTTPLLFGLYLLLRLLRHRLPRWHPGRPVAVAVYVVLGLAAGAVYELSLTVDGTGLGGLHADTGTSFLLLPGFLLPAVAFTAWATGRYALDAAQVFAVAGALTWYETLTVGVTYLVSAPYLAPFVVAFYVTSYAVYTGALGALVLDPAALHAPNARPVGVLRRLGVAVLGGALCWACFAGWGLVVL
jgi:hypothetical protein